MPTIGQRLALRTGIQRDFERLVNALAQKSLIRHPDLASGFLKTHQPFAEDSEGRQQDKRPDEGKVVQQKAWDETERLRAPLMAYIDSEYTIDKANQSATGSVVVNGNTIAENVPAVTLLWWENRVAELIDVFGKLPLLDPDQDWHWDEARGLFVSAPVETRSTKKTNVTKVVINPTEHQPGQFTQWTDDVVTGLYTTIQLSGKMEAGAHRDLMKRLRTLQDAIRLGREEANRVQAHQQHAGRVLTAWIFDGELPQPKAAS